jgi:hypothetical protein
LANPDDDELGWPQGGDSDDDDEPAIIEVALRHGRPIAPDEIGFSGSPTSAPLRNSIKRKSPILWRTFAQSSSPFGSQTTHLVALSMERWR